MNASIDDRGWRMENGQWAPRAILYPLFSVLAFCSLTGCSAASALQYKIAGPPAVAAQYVPAKEPMLVLVENYRASAAGQSDAEMLARQLVRELKAHDVAPLVPLDALYVLRTNEGDAFRKMSMAAVGRKLGAKQVLYVDVQQSSIGAAPGSDLLKGRIGVQVRVVDVETGATRWPAEATEGIPLGYETPLPRADVNTTEAMVRQRMNGVMARNIARLFYKWKPDDSSESLDMGEAG